METDFREQLISAFGRELHSPEEAGSSAGNEGTDDRYFGGFDSENGSEEPELFELEIGNTKESKKRRSRGKRTGTNTGTIAGENAENKASSSEPTSPVKSPKPATKATSKKAKEDGKQTAQMLVDLANSVLENSLGNEAVINANERGLIEPPLARILEKYSPNQIEKFSIIMDPLLLTIGLAIWFIRIKNNVSIPLPTPKEEKPNIPEETPSSVLYNPAAKFSNPTPEELAQWMNS